MPNLGHETWAFLTSIWGAWTEKWGAWTGLGQRLALPWTGLDSDFTMPGQRFSSPRAGLHSDFTRLRQPLAAPSTGLDKDRTLMLEHSGGRPAAVPSWLSRNVTADIQQSEILMNFGCLCEKTAPH